MAEAIESKQASHSTWSEAEAPQHKSGEERGSFEATPSGMAYRGDSAVDFVGVGVQFPEASCNGPNHLVGVVENTAICRN